VQPPWIQLFNSEAQCDIISSICDPQFMTHVGAGYAEVLAARQWASNFWGCDFTRNSWPAGCAWAGLDLLNSLTTDPAQPACRLPQHHFSKNQRLHHWRWHAYLNYNSTGKALSDRLRHDSLHGKHRHRSIRLTCHMMHCSTIDSGLSQWLTLCSSVCGHRPACPAFKWILMQLDSLGSLAYVDCKLGARNNRHPGTDSQEVL
jgi:hypothetical protein